MTGHPFRLKVLRERECGAESGRGDRFRLKSGRVVRSVRGFVVGVVVVTSLAACSTFFPALNQQGGQGQRSTSAPPDTAGVAPDLQPFYGQTLSWSSCRGSFQCTTAKAPLDWSNPGKGSVKLALIRSQSRNAPKGSLLVNPGGPGASGVDFVGDSLDYAVDSTLRADYDIVGFDPRGVQNSTAVKCYGPAETDTFIYGKVPGARNSAEWIAAEEKISSDYAAACVNNTGAVLQYVDTVSAARDLDLLRAVLGDAKLNYLGYSYGTYLGTVYAGLYPAKVGRMVLDGAVDPSLDEFTVTKQQAIGFESALRGYLGGCSARRSCPFTGSVDDSMQIIKKVLDVVDLNPLPGDGKRVVTADTLITAIATPLYQSDAAGELDMLFADVHAGSGKVALQLADIYNSRSSDGTYSDNLTDAFHAISCLDYPDPTDPAVWKSNADALTAAAPVFGKYFAYGEIGCVKWPYQSTVMPGPIAADGSGPIVVVGTTGDPATPYAGAKALASQLKNGHLLTFQGSGHTAYNKSNSCVNNAVDKYFVNGTVPSAGATC